MVSPRPSALATKSTWSPSTTRELHQLVGLVGQLLKHGHEDPRHARLIGVPERQRQQAPRQEEAAARPVPTHVVAALQRVQHLRDGPLPAADGSAQIADMSGRREWRPSRLQDSHHPDDSRDLARHRAGSPGERSETTFRIYTARPPVKSSDRRGTTGAGLEGVPIVLGRQRRCSTGGRVDLACGTVCRSAHGDSESRLACARKTWTVPTHDRRLAEPAPGCTQPGRTAAPELDLFDVSPLLDRLDLGGLVGEGDTTPDVRQWVTGAIGNLGGLHGVAHQVLSGNPTTIVRGADRPAANGRRRARGADSLIWLAGSSGVSLESESPS